MNTDTYEYQIQGHPIERVNAVKYLGVILQDDLKFNSNIEKAISKSSKILGMIKRTLYSAPRKARKLAYTVLCRPILEYGSQVWDPHQRSLVYNLERVQNKAIRFICNAKGRDFSITEARKELQIKSLEERRKQARSTLMLKMMGDYHLILGDFFEHETALNQGIHQTRSRSLNLPPSLSTNSNLYFHSFLPRTIRELRDLLHTDKDE